MITFRTAGAGWRRVAWRGLTAATTTALLGGLVAACGTGASASGQGPITVYSGQHEQTTQSLIDAFEKQTGIQVNVRYDDEDTFTDEIMSEEAHPRADIFYTENSPPLEYLQEKGLLAHVDAATLAKTPSQYNSAQGDWLGISARVSVLIYNPSLIGASKLPETVLQLASPAYQGKLAFAAGETDFQPIVTSLAHTYGQAKASSWLQGIKVNAGPHVYPDNETIADEVNRGAVAFGVVNQY
ncbi:MAG: extracellular solute-binding protein [Streptosporangiaceae bacterium]